MERGLARATVSSYRRDLDKLVRMLDTKETRIESLDARLVTEWILSLSDAGLALTAEVSRTATSLRIAQNRAVEVFSELYNIPTRAEVDEAYRLIHELRKELRALKKATPGS